MGYRQTRHSGLRGINLDNIVRLRLEWTYSLSDTRGQETFPLIHDGKMYVTTHASTLALDLMTARQIWKTLVNYPADTPRVECCGIVNRGVTLYEDKVFHTTLDAHVIALDAETSDKLWRTQSIDHKTGYSMTVAPMMADGVLITGISGGEYGIRGYLEGYDPDTGVRFWRTYTIPALGEPGSETWQDSGDAWTRGGAPTWLTGSYDPELNTVLWGTGNQSSWNVATRPGDNLYAVPNRGRYPAGQSCLIPNIGPQPRGFGLILSFFLALLEQFDRGIIYNDRLRLKDVIADRIRDALQ